MNLMSPQLLLGLLFLPLILFLFYRKNVQAKATFSHLFKVFFSPKGIELKKQEKKQASLPWLFLASSILFFIALSRPQWGKSEVELLESNIDYLVALDVSKSMLAEDIVPTRLDRAKLLATNFISKLHGERVGLLAFTKNAFIEAPLSTDYELLEEILTELSPNDFPNEGTNFAAMLDEALQIFSSNEKAKNMLILLSDGEDHGGGWQQKLAEFKKESIQVLSIGIGASHGAVIRNPNGSLYRDYKGQPIVTIFNPASLEFIARSTGGVYIQADKYFDISTVVEGMIKNPGYTKRKEKMKTHAEKYTYFLLPALILALASFLFEFPLYENREVKLGSKDKS
ncbi:VWA domain-containing protein [Methylacidiphilum caldifontis]|uniref:VWFA domain-containing protein n=1 Tax=Methylacidiphilum caldifontis TaxID=2795386 RepID=A0A4Y8PE17_9BACT|nr:VWA domain-containing protein [Methylacidiphilum caldifontis]TFE69558.1 hypothetical protein A7Q10_06815 [Methylacidiphilum caldifontis]